MRFPLGEFGLMTGPFPPGPCPPWHPQRPGHKFSPWTGQREQESLGTLGPSWGLCLVASLVWNVQPTFPFQPTWLHHLSRLGSVIIPSLYSSKTHHLSFGHHWKNRCCFILYLKVLAIPIYYGFSGVFRFGGRPGCVSGKG